MSLVLTSPPSELTQVIGTVRDNYRPSKFRSVLRVRSDIAEWADRVEVHKITEKADIKPVALIHGDQFPLPSLDKTSLSLKMIQFAAAYRYGDLEIKKAQKMGMSLDTERATSNALKAEQLLDQIAASGDTFGIGLPGLGNNSDVPTVTAVTKDAGGTTWAVATADELLTDLHALVDAVYSNTNETRRADTIVLPLSQFQIVQRLRVSDSTETVASVFLRQRQDPVRFAVWNRFATLGSGTTPRACALDSSSEDVAAMLISREWTADAPRRVPMGWQVEENLIAGGVMIKDAKGIAYMDAL